MSRIKYIFILMLSTLLLIMIITVIYIEVNGLLYLKRMEQMDIQTSEKNVVTDVFWVLETGRNEIRFRKEIPYIAIIEELRSRRNGTINVAGMLNIYIDEKYGKISIRSYMNKIWISWHWNAEKALSASFDRMYFGENTYGLKNAAIHYFNKEYTELDIYEAAELYAYTCSPALYNRKRHPERLESRVESFVQEYLYIKSCSNKK